MIAKFLGSDYTHYPFMEVLLATPIQFVIGARFYKAAYNALKRGAANMDVLVVMGTSAAYFYSWYLIATLGTDAAGSTLLRSLGRHHHAGAAGQIHGGARQTRHDRRDSATHGSASENGAGKTRPTVRNSSCADRRKCAPGISS